MENTAWGSTVRCGKYSSMRQRAKVSYTESIPYNALVKIFWALDHLYEHHNVISPLNKFWDEIYADGGFPFNKDLRIDQRAFFNYLMDFYMYRGSVKGLKFLISVLYDEDCKVSYPREQLLIPSQAHYSNNQYMCVKLNKLEPALHKKITDALNNYSLIIQSVASLPLTLNPCITTCSMALLTCS